MRDERDEGVTELIDFFFHNFTNYFWFLCVVVVVVVVSVKLLRGKKHGSSLPRRESPSTLHLLKSSSFEPVDGVDTKKKKKAA